MSGQALSINKMEQLKVVTPACFLASFVFSILLQFPISAQFPLTLTTYAMLFPTLLAYMIFYRQQMRFIWRDPMVRAVGVLFLFIVLHTIFLTENHDGMAKTLMNTMATAGFVLSSVVFFIFADSICFLRFLKWLSYVAGLSAAISIALYFFSQAYEYPRLVPIGRAHHEILGALSYGVAAFAAMCIAMTTQNNRDKILHGLSVLIISVMIVLTRSRMPMAAYFLCLSIAIWKFANPRQHFQILFLGIGVGLFVMVVPPVRSNIFAFISYLWVKKDGFRLEIWSITYGHIMEHPWIGSGMRALLEHEIAYSPHNLYIATAYYIGIPAALWFVGIVLICVYRAIRRIAGGDSVDLWGAMALFQAVISAMTEHGQLVKTPGPLWLIFWMPMGFTIGAYIKNSEFKGGVPSKSGKYVKTN